MYISNTNIIYKIYLHTLLGPSKYKGSNCVGKAKHKERDTINVKTLKIIKLYFNIYIILFYLILTN